MGPRSSYLSLVSAALDLDPARGCLRRGLGHPDFQNTVLVGRGGDHLRRRACGKPHLTDETARTGNSLWKPLSNFSRLLSRRSAAIVRTPLSIDTSMSRSGSTPGTSALTTSSSPSTNSSTLMSPNGQFTAPKGCQPPKDPSDLVASESCCPAACSPSMRQTARRWLAAPCRRVQAVCRRVEAACRRLQAA